MATSLPELIAAYSATTAQLAAAREAAGKLQLPVIERTQQQIESQLLDQLQPNQPYVLDADHRLLKVRHNLVGWQLMVVPANGVPVVPAQGAVAGWSKLIFVALLTWALTSGAPLKAWDWLRVHFPIPGPIDVVPSNLTDAGKAGFSWSRDFLAKKAGESLVQAGTEIKSHAKPIAAARADNQKRLADLFKVPANTPPEQRPEYPLVKLLDAVIPPGSDPAKVTPQQEEQIGQLLIEYGLGAQGKSK